jgi:GNAT superfamily N-acetyltransferase
MDRAQGHKMKIRRFIESDILALIDLFRTTVHTVCAKDYSAEQLEVWAPQTIDAVKWTNRFNSSFTVIAEHEGKTAGFANLEADGCIDMFYVAVANQNQGVGALLYDALEKEARKCDMKRLHSDVSLTARQFFRSKGFAVEKEYLKQIANINFPNAIMTKSLF